MIHVHYNCIKRNFQHISCLVLQQKQGHTDTIQEGTKYLLYCLSTGLQLEVHKNQEREHDFKNSIPVLINRNRNFKKQI